MAALRWDNEFYWAQSKAALLRVLRSMRATGLPYSLDDVLAALSDLLNKGRSAGMAITISHQSMRGDLAAAERASSTRWSLASSPSRTRVAP